MREKMNKKFKAIVAYGDEAYEIKSEHEGETHTAQEWYEIYSKGCGKYNPTEILEFDTEDELRNATMDAGTSMFPKYYQVSGISDSAYTV
jgi:hypothetical protein